MMALTAIAVRNALGRKLRTALTLLGVAIAIASLIALVALSRGGEIAWQRSLAESDVHLIAIERGTTNVFSSRLPASLAPKLRGVEGVTGLSEQMARLVPAGDAGLQISLNGFDPDAFVWRAINLTSGRLPMAGEVWALVLGERLAVALGKKVGDKVELLYRDFTVIGIARYTSVMNNGSALAPLAALRELTHSRGAVNFFLLRVARPHDKAAVDAVLARLKSVAPRVEFVTADNLARNNDILKLLNAIAWAVSVIAVGMAMVVVTNTLVMAIAERRREIAILGAIGWSTWRIQGLVLIEGLLIAAIGGLLGAGIGVAAALGLASVPAVSSFLDPAFPPSLFLWSAAIVVAIGGAGALYPAYQAARVQPARELQRE